MKKIIALLALGTFLFSAVTFADTYVKGYQRKDGTYVQPHYRSSPDSSYNNNWSVSPNVNPYTGTQGTRQPSYDDKPPTSSWGNDPWKKNGKDY